MGKGYRQGRLAGEITRIISTMLIHSVKDPRLSSMISVSGVDVTKDGSYATVYVQTLITEENEELKAEEEKEILAGLNSAKGLFKRTIGQEIRMRHVPELIFKIDHSMDYGKHIDDILATIDFDSYQKDDESEDDI